VNGSGEIAKAPDETPSLARIIDYFLCGYRNFAVDRAVAEDLARSDPNFPLVVRVNRAFLRRSVRFLAEQGIDQFLDLGSNITSVGNVHDVAQQVNPTARVVYVESDPAVVQHSRTLLEDQPAVSVVQADIFQPEAILAHPEVRRGLDFTRPLAVLLLAVLHFLPDDAQALHLVRMLCDAMPSGSYLALSHGTTWVEHPSRAGKARSREEIAAFFEGLELVEPGLVYAPHWRPEDKADPLLEAPEQSLALAGVGRKP